ncbi:MAG TPA: type II toxin-antitoxin system RelE/ParE family toxin [Caulobacter sp.]|nr:type II toxin-antitoxin system RelE/ParE family toxin [Caulobacter sp.]
MRRVVWTDEARANLQAIRDYIAQFSPLAAQRFSMKLVTTAEDLAENPDRGRSVGNGRRELALIRPYLIRYGSRPRPSSSYGSGTPLAGQTRGSCAISESRNSL